jgi:hypothetical protein
MHLKLLLKAVVTGLSNQANVAYAEALASNSDYHRALSSNHVEETYRNQQDEVPAHPVQYSDSLKPD